MLDSILADAYAFTARNPLLLVAVLFFLCKKWESTRPWPDYGGNVQPIASVDAFKAAQRATAEANELLLVDCYATWCPPCRAAAPTYARMSDEYARSCTFAKARTDAQRTDAHCTDARQILPEHLSLSISLKNKISQEASLSYEPQSISPHVPASLSFPAFPTIPSIFSASSQHLLTTVHGTPQEPAHSNPKPPPLRCVWPPFATNAILSVFSCGHFRLARSSGQCGRERRRGQVARHQRDAHVQALPR